jgi:hypothetical protein
MVVAIVSETCGPFTVLPAVMNEYRIPEINVQNGVLKAHKHFSLSPSHSLSNLSLSCAVTVVHV